MPVTIDAVSRLVPLLAIALLAACAPRPAVKPASMTADLLAGPVLPAPAPLADESLGPRSPWPQIVEAALSAPLESWPALEGEGWSVRFPPSFQLEGGSGIWKCASTHRCRLEVDERGISAAEYVAGAKQSERTIAIGVYDLDGDPLVVLVDRRNDGTEWTWLFRRHGTTSFTFGYASREPPKDFLAMPQTMRFADAI